MHRSSMLRMQWFKTNFLNNSFENQCVSVLDVGSQCVSGQEDTYKILFGESHFKYIGLDVVAGRNVDICVKNAYIWNEVSDDFCDVLISGQMLEHVEFPWLTISEMARVLKPSGLLCIIVPSMQKLHRFPVNCQNYFADGLIALIKYAGLQTIHASTNYAPVGAEREWYCTETQDSMIIARKPNNWKRNSFDKLEYKCEPADLDEIATGFIPMEEQGYGTHTVDINTNIEHIGSILIGNHHETIFVIDSEKNLYGTITMNDFFRKAVTAKTISELMDTDYKNIELSTFEETEEIQLKNVLEEISNNLPVNIDRIPVTSNNKFLYALKRPPF